MRGFVKRCAEKKDPADFVIDDVSFQVLEKCAVLVGELCVDADMDQFADLFIDRHLLYQFGCSFLRFLARPEIRARLRRSCNRLQQNYRSKDKATQKLHYYY